VKLSTAGFIEPAEGVALAEAYGFLRQVEKQLRVERERSVDTLPAAEEKLSTLARRMGLKDRSPAGLAQAFLQEYERLTGVVRQLYERIVEREASAR
jgi:glutamate-ammonia-ligase adenylyltransferase